MKDSSYFTSFQSPTTPSRLRDDFGQTVAINHDGTRIAIREDLRENLRESPYHVVHLFNNHGDLLYTFRRPEYVADITQESFRLNGTFNFGQSLAMNCDGSRILIGAPFQIFGGKSYDSNYYPGAVYLFNDHGELLQTFNHFDPNSFWGGEYGKVVDINCDGTRVLVGAPLDNQAKGGAYLYQDTGEHLRTFVMPEASRQESEICFGTAVSINYEGDKVLIGDIYRDPSNINGNDRDRASGGAFLFNSEDGSIVDTFRSPLNETKQGFFGDYVAMAKCNDKKLLVGGQSADYLLLQDSPDWKESATPAFTRFENEPSSSYCSTMTYAIDCGGNRVFHADFNQSLAVLMDPSTGNFVDTWNIPNLDNKSCLSIHQVLVSGNGDYGVISGQKKIYQHGDLSFVYLYQLGPDEARPLAPPRSQPEWMWMPLWMWFGAVFLGGSIGLVILRSQRNESQQSSSSLVADKESDGHIQREDGILC